MNHHLDVSALKEQRGRIVRELLERRAALVQELVELDKLLEGMGPLKSPAAARRPTEPDYQRLLHFVELHPRCTIGEAARGMRLDYGAALRLFNLATETEHVQRREVDHFPRFELTPAGRLAAR